MGMENVKYIKLSNYNDYAIVDSDLYEELNAHRWSVDLSKNKFTRVTRSRKKVDPPGKSKISMHHAVIGGLPKGMVVDHINHNVLDNRRANLRVCTPAENSRNRQPLKNKQVKYKGVIFDKTSKKNPFRAVIKKISLGQYNVAEKAALAYNNAATEHYGEYACLNHIPTMIDDPDTQLVQGEFELL
jgi:hypothetical protein